MFTNCSIDQTDVQGMYDWKKTNQWQKEFLLMEDLQYVRVKNIFHL